MSLRKQDGIPFPYEVIKSERKTMAISIRENADVIVRIPYRVSYGYADTFVLKNKEWIIQKRNEVIIKAKDPLHKTPSKDEILQLQEKAADILPKRIAYWSAITGLCPTGFRITAAKKRFGSCSAKNSLCFSYLLMRYPDDLIDYVVLHEIAHIKHHNHSAFFYAFLNRYMPDYRQRQEQLKKM